MKEGAHDGGTATADAAADQMEEVDETVAPAIRHHDDAHFPISMGTPLATAEEGHRGPGAPSCLPALGRKY